MDGNRKIRVLIVDDSAVVRETLKELINDNPRLEVMAVAEDPYQAVERIRDEVPDVITLDVEMPKMDGITFLRRLMSQRPIPVVVCSSLVGAGTQTTLAALDAGAVDIVKKPAVGTRRFLEESRIQIQDKIIAAANARLIKPAMRVAATPPPNQRQAPNTAPCRPIPSDQIVAIGGSTGGTDAIRTILAGLGPDSPPLVIVQHMPETFTGAFAERLNSICTIGVSEAKGGELLTMGHALIAPGNMHLRVKRGGSGFVTDVQDGPLISRHRPSVDALFHSVAEHVGRKALGIILTGMGKDGAEGLKAMRTAGARTLGQDEPSCIVYGMSRVATEMGATEREVPLDKISGLIKEFAADKKAGNKRQQTLRRAG